MDEPQNSALNDLKQRLKDTGQPNLATLLDRRDGAAALGQTLPRAYSPHTIIEGSPQCTAWEQVGLYYLNQRRPHEALPIFKGLYEQMLIGQEQAGQIHKGMPLVWIYECYLMMGFVALPKRYLILTLIEDAIRDNGRISPETGGTYFRLVWRHGLAHAEVERYAKQAYDLSREHPIEAIFPEWALLELDSDWMTEYPAPQRGGHIFCKP